jgi:hypothetical protein
MRACTKSRAAIVAAACLSIAGRTWAGESGETIAVEVHDYARVPPAILAAAAEEAARVLHKAGIEVRWTLGLTPRVGTPAGVEAAELPLLTVEIFAPRHATPVRSPSVLGFTVLPADGSQGVYAGVRYGAVERQLRETAASLPQVLGYVIAHEVGHLLLGTNAHAAWGVMSAQLSGAYFDRAAQGTLLFAPDEAAQLRKAIRSRRVLAPSVARIE